MPAETRETVVRWLDARSRRDLDALGGLTAVDATWESPVTGLAVGREEVVRQVEEGYDEPDEFSSEVLSLDNRADRAIVVVHNTGRKGEETLDSLQTLFLRIVDGLIAEVRVAVDDERAVEAFWAE